ncbi:TPA: protein YkfM, partial [Escherichia coli]
LIAIVIAPLIAPFVTGYVNDNYHPCGNNTGIFPGATYIKNGMKCNNEYISRKED